MERFELHIEAESRIRWKVYVRFGGEFSETDHSNMARRRLLSLQHKKKDSLVVDIMHTQSQLAEYLNVSRPALSKEINKMMKEGLVIMEGKRIEILDKTTLEKYL